jgi:hypothetical protein
MQEKKQEKDPAELVKETIALVKKQKNYKVEFETKLEIPRSDPFETKGTIIKESPDILYIHYTGTGGIDKKIVRKGKLIRILHPVFEVWVDPITFGDPYAGKGIQNPDEILNFINKAVKKEKVKFDKKERKFLIKLSGKAVADFLEDQGIGKESIKWEGAKIKIYVFVDKQSLVSKCYLMASMPGKGEMKGRIIKYKGKIEVKGYNQEFKKPFSLPEKTKKEIGITR